MKTEIRDKSMRVIEVRTLIEVPHLDGKLTFAYPLKGPVTYTKVGKQIDSDKTPSQLYRPTTAETISLVYAAFKNKDDKYPQKILKILRERYFWCFTKNLWTPKGVYVVNDRDGSRLNREDLEKRLDGKDVRFVPKDKIKLGEQTPGELETNDFVIAHAGEEGAQKLAEIAGEFDHNPYVNGLENVTEDIERVTGLDGDWCRDWLGFNGDCSVDIGFGCAAGVQK